MHKLDVLSSSNPAVARAIASLAGGAHCQDIPGWAPNVPSLDALVCVEVQPATISLQQLRAITDKNAFGTAQFFEMTDSDTAHRHGSALFLLASMFNHSDQPGASWMMLPGGTIVVRAIRDFDEGEEVFVSYGAEERSDIPPSSTQVPPALARARAATESIMGKITEATTTTSKKKMLATRDLRLPANARPCFHLALDWLLAAKGVDEAHSALTVIAETAQRALTYVSIDPATFRLALNYDLLFTVRDWAGRSPWSGELRSALQRVEAAFVSATDLLVGPGSFHVVYRQAIAEIHASQKRTQALRQELEERPANGSDASLVAELAAMLRQSGKAIPPDIQRYLSLMPGGKKFLPILVCFLYFLASFPSTLYMRRP